MYLDPIPDGVFTSTIVRIKYDCDGGFERCGREWTLKYVDASKNFENNGGNHICRKCGLTTNNPGNRPEARAKQQQTMLKRYGVTCALNTPENTKARVEKMFGTEEATKKIVKKRRATSRERYGVDHPMKSPAIRDKQKLAFMQKYGVDNPLKSKEVRDRLKQTLQKRYGESVTNIVQVPGALERRSASMIDRFGVEFYNQLPSVKEFLSAAVQERFADNWENSCLKGVAQTDEQREKHRQAVLRLIQSGEWKGGPKYTLKGDYVSSKCSNKRTTFRSSYELKVHWHLDHLEAVEWYEYEPFTVQYLDEDGVERAYIVDFVVSFSTGEMVAIEVKNDYSRKADKVARKQTAFIEQCGALMGYEIWSNAEIAALNIDLDTVLMSDRVTLWK